MTIGIISAMDSEHRRLVERLQDKNTSGDGSFRYVEGTLGGNHVILTQCGIGKVSAAVGGTDTALFSGLHRQHRCGGRH